MTAAERVTAFLDAWDARIYARPDKEIAWMDHGGETLELWAHDLRELLAALPNSPATPTERNTK